MPYDLNVNFNTERTSVPVENLSFVNPTGFRLVIDSLKYPNAQFMVQQVALPDISVEAATYSTPFRDIGMSGGKVNYGELSLTFLIDEQLTNYQEIHDWLFGLVSEQDSKSLKKNRDLTLMVLSSANNVIKQIQFVDAYPTTLGSLPFDVTQTDIEYLTATVSFGYSYFRFV
tara:strand:- start:696 stop:1211 length:516 start_codon:yes stop_codon:yes gene_type:complete